MPHYTQAERDAIEADNAAEINALRKQANDRILMIADDVVALRVTTRRLTAPDVYDVEVVDGAAGRLIPGLLDRIETDLLALQTLIPKADQ